MPRLIGAHLSASANLSDLIVSSTARTNLGLGSLATASTINNANWSGTALALGNGGTGQTTAALAQAALNASATTVAVVGSTFTLNGSVDRVFKITLNTTGMTVILNNQVAGATYVIQVYQDGTGSRTVTTWTGFQFGTAGNPTLTTTASRYDLVSGVSDGTNIGAVVKVGGFT